MFLFYLIIFLFGLIIGSFLNCVIYRLEKEESFFSGRSYCPFCKHTLAWFDLVPVLSFLFLRGHCRYCREKISWQYPLAEIATGAIFLLFFIHFELSLFLPYYLIISGFLIIIFVFDLKHFIIPDRVIFPAIAVAAAWHFLAVFCFELYHWKDLLGYVFSGLGAAAFFLIIVLVTRGKGMGIGDIKLAFFMGLVLGWPGIYLALILSFFSGSLIGVALMMAKKKTMKSEIPFGPFLILGTFVVLFWGEEIFDWYQRFFLV